MPTLVGIKKARCGATIFVSFTGLIITANQVVVVGNQIPRAPTKDPGKRFFKSLLMKKMIMLADDDPDILFTLGMVLENEGYEVFSTLDGSYVLDGQYEYPDLYLLDKHIPDMDGVEICRRLRQKTASRNIPVIIISASHQARQQALNAGANAFLEKPFDLKVLLQMVRKFTAPG